MSDDNNPSHKVAEEALDFGPKISLEDGYGYSRVEALPTLYADVV